MGFTITEELLEQDDTLHSSTPSFSNNSAQSPVDIIRPLPDLSTLIEEERETRSEPTHARLHWAGRVLGFASRIEELVHPSVDERLPADNRPGVFQLKNPDLRKLIQIAIAFVQKLTQVRPQEGDELMTAEAVYLLADILASGSYPEYCERNIPLSLFMFEKSALMGWTLAWFRLGMHYEGQGDPMKANDHFRRGVQGEDPSCLYRMGMAYLLGQLGRSIDHSRAFDLLRKSADAANEDFPAAAYVFGMLLAGEFDLPDTLDTTILEQCLDQIAEVTDDCPSPSMARLDRAIDYLEKAATLSFPAAQFKLGYCYEHALLGCEYNPVLSVQWYLLSSENGELEADMALSKWFLAGAPNCLPVRQELAFSFAEKAARKGLPHALFAVGYYYEIGIGKPIDLALAQKWYKRASRAHHPEAKSRLSALSGPKAAPILLKEHQHHLDDKLVRKRTDAIARSQRTSLVRSEASVSHQNSLARPSRPPSVTSSATSSSRRHINAQTSFRWSADELDRAASIVSQLETRPSFPSDRKDMIDPVQYHPAEYFSPSYDMPDFSHRDDQVDCHPRYTLQEVFVNSSTLNRQHPPMERARPPRTRAGMDNSRQEGSKYQSFHEMGFAPVKAEDKDCVIM
ncbi:Extracellular protein SEL-1 and related proteins [Phaffia rhodozyma]|uniref:Extracellular protein SEL-1 and related proteins n=1 Tax=Phaffia rhodozyma TaxID=264483 RepID=A0A0F7SRM2_PHARH|nr:Extracellular protein SEL-1 and related proteins [Phaffia rhodozyma]